MHPELPKAAKDVPLVADTGGNQRILEAMLVKVGENLEESRLIRIAGQRACETAVRAVEKIPALERRMNRVELIAIGATIINIVMLFVASCVR
jgi:hypothetical protein